MREAQFLRKNAKKWQNFERTLQEKPVNPDVLSSLFVEITDDLAFSQTNYSKSKTTVYLNQLAGRLHTLLYKNKKEKKNRFVHFWMEELPMVFFEVRQEMLYSFLFFTLFCVIGAISTHYDETFVRLILGDEYVNMTLDNIKRDDPMNVYKSHSQGAMFIAITFNNIMVALRTFGMGVMLSVGTVYILFNNGVMVGAFQYFFFQHNLLFTSALTIWIHGTIEISSIVVGGAAGLAMGNSILFPGTYTRLVSFQKGALKGMKTVIGLIPLFIVAGFLESYVTRYTEFPTWLKLTIILSSAGFVLYYFVIYPAQLHKKAQQK